MFLTQKNFNKSSQSNFPYKTVFEKKFMGKNEEKASIKKYILDNPIEKKWKQLNDKIPSFRPKVYELEQISKSDKKDFQRNQKLTKLELYMNRRLFKRQDYSLQHIAQNGIRKQISDKELNNDFKKFLSTKAYSTQTTGFFNSHAQKANKLVQLQQRRSKIKNIIHEMIDSNRINDQDLIHNNLWLKQPKLIKSQSKIQDKKSIEWILNQCSQFQKKYDKNRAFSQRKIKKTLFKSR